MEAIVSVVSDIVLEASRLHVAVWLNASLLFVLMALFSAHRDLKKKFHLTEALLLEKSIGVHSRNWTATAINLEKKAQEPGDVARSSALTFLHLLDEAAEAWLKGSQWHEALRVTLDDRRKVGEVESVYTLVVTGPIVTPTLFTPPVPDDTVVPVPDGGAPVPAGV